MTWRSVAGLMDEPVTRDKKSGPSQVVFGLGKRRRRTQGRVWAVHIDLDQATDLVRHTLILALLVSTPMLAIGLVVGIVVSLFQAVTQIQEQTLTFVPKIVAMVAAAIFLFPWMSHYMVEYAQEMFGRGFIR